MLDFNLLLQQANLDTGDVYLVRHKDTRIPKGILRSRGSSPYNLWLTQREKFDCYQRLQSEDCFRKRNWIAAFVVTPEDETLFAGMYRKRGVGKLPEELRECPVSGKPVGNDTHVYYDLAPADPLSEWIGRLTIEWAGGFRSWIQKADSKESGAKRIVEVRKDLLEPPFPGYREFLCDLAGIERIRPSWQSQLRNCRGIYLLTCKDTGKQYVGKADGEGGFWGRFCEYAQTGHGGNEGMKPHRTSGYRVTILEALATPAFGEIDRLEALWKEKLGARIWGLNKN